MEMIVQEKSHILTKTLLNELRLVQSVIYEVY